MIFLRHAPSCLQVLLLFIPSKTTRVSVFWHRYQQTTVCQCLSKLLQITVRNICLIYDLTVLLKVWLGLGIMVWIKTNTSLRLGNLDHHGYNYNHLVNVREPSEKKPTLTFGRKWEMNSDLPVWCFVFWVDLLKWVIFVFFFIGRTVSFL